MDYSYLVKAEPNNRAHRAVGTEARRVRNTGHMLEVEGTWAVIPALP